MRYGVRSQVAACRQKASKIVRIPFCWHCQMEMPSGTMWRGSIVLPAPLSGWRRERAAFKHDNRGCRCTGWRDQCMVTARPIIPHPGRLARIHAKELAGKGLGFRDLHVRLLSEHGPDRTYNGSQPSLSTTSKPRWQCVSDVVAGGTWRAPPGRARCCIGRGSSK